MPLVYQVFMYPHIEPSRTPDKNNRVNNDTTLDKQFFSKKELYPTSI